MKCFIAFFACLAVANSLAVFGGKRSHLSQNVTDLIKDYGYPVQNFTVQTEDGYLLDVIRIPGNVEYRHQFEENQHQQNKDDVTTEKEVVVLMHGLLSSAEDYVIGGPSEGLAFILADMGMDVFLANARGNTYARKHTTLNPEKDAAFWKFCWQEIGTKDLPAIIDEVLRMTQQQKVNYIGHMQGATAFYVMASERPEYNDKINNMISLGPIAFMKEATNKMMKSIAENQQSKAWQMKNLGMNEFHPSNEFIAVAGEQDCVANSVNERVCQNPYFLINGYESKNMNMSTILRYVARLPAGASTRQILHFTQMMKTGRFEKYSPEMNQVEEYDLSKITAPVTVIYTPQDKLSSVQDVKMLISKLPNMVEEIVVKQLTNNVDLLFAKNVKSVVYNLIMDVLKGR